MQQVHLPLSTIKEHLEYVAGRSPDYLNEHFIPRLEEFLGLECVRHARPAMAVRCGMKFHIVCVEVGSALRPCGVLNHWGMDVGSREEVDRVHRMAKELKEEYGIRQVLDVVDQHGVYSFYMEDLDHNWWEIQHYDGFQHDDMFDFGDRFSMDEDSDIHDLKELEIQNAG